MDEISFERTDRRRFLTILMLRGRGFEKLLNFGSGTILGPEKPYRILAGGSESSDRMPSENRHEIDGLPALRRCAALTEQGAKFF